MRKKCFLAVAAVVLVTVAVVIITVIRSVGYGRLKATKYESEVGSDGVYDLLKKDRIISYEGQDYRFNDDATIILIMGIDKDAVNVIGGQSWTAAEYSQLAGGQADALFLIVLNPHTKTVSALAINRNTMTYIDVYDDKGDYIGSQVHQICLQHGYGDGGVESCERQAVTVSAFLDGIPINAYAAISMDAIAELNDAIGGVEVTVLEDLVYPEVGVELYEGDAVLLDGNEAYWYVRLRDKDSFNSQAARLERQKQYLTGFAVKARKQVLSDISFATELFETTEKYMTTDIDASSFTYLISEAIAYEFDTSDIYAFEGETVLNNDFEEFYPDPDNKQKLLIELFYEPVNDINGTADAP